jgi:hypothetical protein
MSSCRKRRFPYVAMAAAVDDRRARAHEYREIAERIRELARRSQFRETKRQLYDWAHRYDQTADYLASQGSRRRSRLVRAVELKSAVDDRYRTITSRSVSDLAYVLSANSQSWREIRRRAPHKNGFRMPMDAASAQTRIPGWDSSRVHKEVMRELIGSRGYGLAAL